VLTVVAGLTALLGLAQVGVAAADNDGGVVVTPVDPHGRLNPPAVDVNVDASGRGQRTPRGHAPNGAGTPARSGRSPTQPVRCTYLAEPELEPAMRAIGGFGGAPPGAHLYSITCGLVSAGFVWLDPAAVPRNSAPSARGLAERAARRLPLTRPVIGLSPGRGVPQLVRVPTWLWIDPSSWRPRSATAAVPGLTATATATPISVAWSTGDGTTLTCDGPGTRYATQSADPAAASPDCGHTYTRAQQAVITATVTWRVSWTSQIASGVLPPLHTTSSLGVQVVQAQTANR
jgi:hypothetical protein